MKLCLIVNKGKKALSFDIEHDAVSIGRSDRNDIQVHDRYVSNRHLIVWKRGNRLFLNNLGNRNGTRVNGMPIQPHHRVLLQPDAIIEVGQTQLQFKRLGGVTRQLEAQPPARPPHAGIENVPQPTPPPAPGQRTSPPIQVVQPRKPKQKPPDPGPGQQGGPTRPV